MSYLIDTNVLSELRRKQPDARVMSWMQARLMAHAGRPLPAIDGLLAATALQHDLTLVTRNTKDFSALDVRLINPWDAQDA